MRTNSTQNVIRGRLQAQLLCRNVYTHWSKTFSKRSKNRWIPSQLRTVVMVFSCSWGFCTDRHPEVPFPYTRRYFCAFIWKPLLRQATLQIILVAIHWSSSLAKNVPVPLHVYLASSKGYIWQSSLKLKATISKSTRVKRSSTGSTI